MPTPLRPITLTGRHVVLEPLSPDHVAICTDADNTRSRAAIERVAATFEGVLRNHRMKYGTSSPRARHTAVYSVIGDEWPTVRAGLTERLR